MKKLSKRDQKFLAAIAETAKTHADVADNFVIVKKDELQKVLGKPVQAAEGETCLLWGHDSNGQPICLQWG